jgi:hypothetical protein
MTIEAPPQTDEMMDVGYSLLNPERCWLLDARCWIVKNNRIPFVSSIQRPESGIVVKFAPK